MRKNLRLLLLSVVCILSGFYLNAQETVFTGSCGATENDNLTWTLDTQSNTLTISGSGAMTDYDNETNKAPWLAYNDDDLQTLKLEEGITHIGDYAFYNRTYFSDLWLPTTLSSIGDYAFGRCLSITNVTALPETAPLLESNSFSNVRATLFHNHKDSSYNDGYWASNFSDRYEIYVDKVGENVCSVVNPNRDGGIHYIIGTGAMYDYTSDNLPPYSYTVSLYPCTTLSIEEGITHIGDYAFYNRSCYTSYSTPLSVTTIGDYAFNSCFKNSELTLLTADCNVTHIGNGAFGYCGGKFSFPETLVHIGKEAFMFSEMTSLTLPENLEYIDDMAFYHCDKITGDLTIPNSITYIGESAFSDCYGLDGHVTLSASLDTLGEMAFNSCDNIKGLTIPEGVKYIDQYAFNNCYNLTGNLTIPNSVTHIGKSAFNNCENLNGTLTLSENLTAIGEGIFSNCNFTGTLVIPGNVTSIGYSAFMGCDFTGDLNIPDGVTSIGGTAFYECSFNGTLNIPNSVDTIGYGAFYRCAFAGTINIPDGVASIGENAFQECGYFEELVLGRDLTEIGANAFKDCSLLQKVTSLATTAPTLGTDAFIGINPNATLYYPEAGQQSYTDNGWLQYFSSSNNKMCGDFAFYEIDLATGKLTITGSGAMWDYDGTTQAPWRQYATQITSLEIHDGITSIGKNAFYQMSALTGAVTIPESVTIIRESAFQGCTNINELTIYDGLTNIENNAFFLNVALNKVTTFATTAPTLGSNVFTNISADAVLYCPEEAEASYIEKGWNQYFTISTAPIYGGKCGDYITWSLNTTTGELSLTGTGWMWEFDSYENRAPWYEHKDNIKSLSLSEGIVSIGNEAFRYLDKVEEPLVLPQTLEHIGMYSFSDFGTDGIGALTIPESVYGLVDGAFKGNYFSEINIPPHIEIISIETFANSHNITSITIPEHVTQIMYGAFYGCENLKDIVISGNVGNIEDNAFNCSNLETCTVLSVPAPTLGAGGNVFSPEIYETAILYHHPDGIYNNGRWQNYFANRYAVYTGTCGEDAYWTLNVTTGELRIYGTGAMDNYNYSSNSRMPWNNYKDLITSVVVEEGITNVGSYAFHNNSGSCTNLTSFTLANTVTSIGNEAFNSTGLTGTINIPASVTSIGNSAFRSCTGITALNIAGAASIGNYAFADCTGITSLTKANISKVTSIGNYAFYNCSALTSVVIPYTVTTIGDYAFNGCSQLATLEFNYYTVPGKIPTVLHTLTSIGNYAFDGCSNLSGVLTIPYSVVTIGNYAFRNCTSLNGLQIHTRYTTGYAIQSPTDSELTTIGNYAFENCTGIRGTALHENKGIGVVPVPGINKEEIKGLDLKYTKLTSIGDYAFYGCDFSYPAKIASAPDRSGTIRLPSTLTTIGSYAFYSTNIGNINFPESLEEIGRSAFAECAKLTAVDLSKTNINFIDFYAFKNCTKISSLLLPVNDSYTTIHKYTFEGCSSIKEVIFPNNVTAIDSYSFYGCTALERVVLPNALSTDSYGGVGYLAFGACPNIKEVYATEIPTGDPNDFVYRVLNVFNESVYEGYQQESGSFTVNTIDNGNAVLIYPVGAKAYYTHTHTSGFDNNWQVQFPVMYEGVYSGQCGENAYYTGVDISESYYSGGTYISYENSKLIISGHGDMYNYTAEDPAPWNTLSADTIIINDNITSIGDYAFDSKGWTKIVMGASDVTYVGERSFYCNYQLENISVADNAYIGDSAFYYCWNMSYDDFIANASHIGDYAFCRCDNLILDTELNLKNATYIGARAFYDCAGFTGGLKIGKANTIGEYAFCGTNFTGSLILPNSLNTLGESAFQNCAGFNGTLTLSNSLVTISDYTFSGCSGITGELTIPESVTSIGTSAFYNCSGFTGTLSIPEGVNVINNYSFYNCNGLTALELHDNITSIGESAFYACTGITGEIVLSNKLASIGKSAFYNVPFTDVVTFRRQPATLGTSVFNAITGNVYVPYQYKDAYLSATNWSDYSDKTVAMPTYVELSGGVKYWNGISSGIEPLATDRVALDATLDIENGNTLTVESFGYCGLDDETFGYLTIKDGGQLFHNKAYNDATLEKEILGYGNENMWYTIASPLKNILTIIPNSSSLTPNSDYIPNSSFLIPNSDYDLYRYDEPTFTWQNSKPGEGSTNFQTIDPGRGYLYASAEDATLQFNGHLNTDAVTYNLTAQGEELTGFHLIGNPFAHDIYFEESIVTTDSETSQQILVNGYYVLTGEGAWAATASTTEAIKPGQGILVKSLVDNYELAISRQLSAVSPQRSVKRSQQTTDNRQQSLFTLSVTDGKYSDKAFVVFDNGVGLDKINHENENIPLLYIPMEDTDYAIAMMDENVNEIPVNFETNVMGQYTISLRQENCRLSELYLLDKETGEKVNILEEDYTFMATSYDSAERFVLMMNYDSDTDNSHFAYINNGDIVIFDIEGYAQIRIVDALGRCVYNGEASDETDRISTSDFANGVYIIEKIDDKGINVQKMIL